MTGGTRIGSRRGQVVALIAALLTAWAEGHHGAEAQTTTFAETSFTAETVATLPQFMPVGVAAAPGGRLFVWQRNGIVRIVQDGVLLPAPFIDIRHAVNQYGDRGLLGLAVDPEFQSTGFVYLLYTYEPGGDPIDSGPKTARLTRIQADPAGQNVALAGSAVEILGGLPSEGSSHSIGAVLVAPDGTLLVSVGDAASYAEADALALRAQDLGSASGKILRINPDGSAPATNPFYDGPSSMRSKVWAYGLRNPFRFALHPLSGEPYISDVGWDSSEEINRGRAGRNFGWPCWEGLNRQPVYGSAFPSQCQGVTATAPLYAYDHDVGGAAVSGTFYTGQVYPDQYRGSLFVADYTAGWIRRLVLDAGGELESVHDFAADVAGPVSIAQGSDGLLYYVELNTGRVIRVRYNGTVARATATPTSGGSPLTVAFSSAGSSVPGGGLPAYHWNFGDGATSTVADPKHTYTATAVRTFAATLTATAPDGATASTSVSVTVGSRPPVPTISTPVDSTVLRVGDTVEFQGAATDPDEGSLGPAALEWTVLLHHDTHVHPVLTTTGAGGRFVVVSHGAGAFSHEVVLTATDASGLTASTSVLLPISPQNPVRVTSVTVSPNPVQGGSSAAGAVIVLQPAGTGGATVGLASSSQSLHVPATVTVPAGASSAAFIVTTSAVSASVAATVTATLAGSAQVAVTLTPPATKRPTSHLPPTRLAVTSVAPGSATQGATASVTIRGRSFASGARCGFGAGITVTTCGVVSPTQTTARIRIAAGAAVGKRTVTVTNPDGRSASLASAFTVKKAPTSPPGPAPLSTR